MKKIELPEEQAEEIVKAILEAGEVKLGTKSTSLFTIKASYYEVEIHNVNTHKREKRKSLRLTATKGQLFKNRD